jgi:hypothetical protein
MRERATSIFQTGNSGSIRPNAWASNFTEEVLILGGIQAAVVEAFGYEEADAAVVNGNQPLPVIN